MSAIFHQVVSITNTHRNDSARNAANAFYPRLKCLIPVHMTDYGIAKETSDPLLNITWHVPGLIMILS